MNKIFKSFLTVCMTLLLLLTVGCNDTSKKESTPKKKADFPVTITDATKKEITIEKEPQKIVSLIPSNTETAFALGLNEEIIGVSEFDNYPEEATKKEKVSGMEVNVEKIISLNPDLVLAHESMLGQAGQAFDQLKASNINVIVIRNATNFKDVYESINTIGKATGKSEQATKIVKDMKSNIESIKNKVQGESKQKVWVEVSPAPEIYTTGDGTFMHEMLSLLGAENVAGDQQGWVKLSEEIVVQKNPDVILTTYGAYTPNATQLVLDRKAWANVNAIKNKKVFDLSDDLVSRPGPRLAKGVEEIAKALYPEIIK
ncbi:MAG: ABC-type cobalamin/Fe3+-siderophore transport system, periplasmic component [Bacillales bacterium]|nr:ABC-type cobalamin/Fe3+-siderophore transport system, periplasmic component [Bacillales bacterium]